MLKNFGKHLANFWPDWIAIEAADTTEEGKAVNGKRLGDLVDVGTRLQSLPLVGAALIPWLPVRPRLALQTCVRTFAHPHDFDV